MGVLGMTVAGCMIANYVSIQTVATFTSGDTVIEIQALLDEIMPGILRDLSTVFSGYQCRWNR